jgi:hypothetical protein
MVQAAGSAKGATDQRRAAHFIGVRAAQVLPLIGFPMTSSLVRGPAAGVVVASLATTALWGAPLVQAMQGLPLIGL